MFSVSRKLMLLFLALLVASSAMAGEGRIPVYNAGGITVIGSPGKYLVTENIALPFCPAALIFIASADVDLDLNGFTITGCGSLGEALIKVDGVDNVAIRNGTLRTGEWGINAVGAAAGSHKLIVEDVKFEGQLSYGIKIERVSDFALRRNNIYGTLAAGGGGEGIYINAGGGGQITENTVQRVASNGIHLANSNDNLLRHNVVTGSGVDGLLIDGQRNQVSWNVLNSNGRFGLHFSALGGLNTFGRNTARGNPGPPPVCLVGGATTDYCNEGAGNSSFNDNFMPNLF